MSAASLASYLIRTLKSDQVTTEDMSGSGRGSSTPRLTTVWRTTSFPYDIPDTSNSFRNEGSLLRLLRTKSMPLLGREGSTPSRRSAVPQQSRSPARSESLSPVRRLTTRAVNARNMSSGHLSDASESTVTSLATPPPTPRSPSPSGTRLRSASDGHLWQRRKKQLRCATDEAAVMLPSVNYLRGKFDEKPASPPGNEQPPPTSDQVDNDIVKQDSETGEGQERRMVSRHYSLMRREVKSPVRRHAPKPAVTPANVRKLLEKFETSPQNEDEAGEAFMRSNSQDLGTKCRSEVSLNDNTLEVSYEDQTRQRRSHKSRQRTKNHRRSKSEPDPSAVLRLNLQTSPPSVKKLKIMFEKEALAMSGNDVPMDAVPERTILLEQQKEVTYEPPQVRVSRRKPAEETAIMDKSVADTHHLGVMDTTGPRKQDKTPPMVKVDQVLVAGTPSVKNLRQRFEEGASTQSLLKTAENEVAVKPRRITVHELKTPFEEPERQISKSVSPEKETRQSLTSFSSASVKNLMRQFETVLPEESKQDDLGHDPRSPRSPPPTDSQKQMPTLALDHATGDVLQGAESPNKVTLEMELDSNWRRQSWTSSSESSSDDEWREEEGRRRRKKMERVMKREEEEKAKEMQKIEEEQKMLREKTEIMNVQKEEERIRKEKEKENREKERAELERKTKEREEERRALEILEKVKEAKKKAEEESKIRERLEQERFAKEEEEKRKEREYLEQNKKEKEKAELETGMKERKEKERMEQEREEETRKEIKRAKHENEMQEKAEEERREREKVEREKTQKEEQQKKQEREETERFLNEQQEEQKRKEENRSSREDHIRRLSYEEITKGVGREEAYQNNDNKSDEKSSDHKVHEMIDRFKPPGPSSDTLPQDASSPPQGEASASVKQRVEQLIDQFTNLQDADLEGEARQDDIQHELDRHENEDGHNRRSSDVAALVNVFKKLNERRRSSSSSESDNSESGKSHEKHAKKPPIPTIPVRSICPGTVRTPRESEMMYFEAGGTDNFMRTQSLRVKKSEASHFTQPRFGSLRGSKSRVAVISSSSTTNAALPRNCRHLKKDELQFFTGEVTNIYHSRTTKPRDRTGKTARGDGRPPKVPRSNALPDTEEFFRIAGRDNPGSEPNGRPAPSEDDSDSDHCVLRQDDMLTDSEGDIYEMDINLRSDVDTEDPSDTEHHYDLDNTLSLFVHTIQGELLQPVATEDCQEAESRCYVVFSPGNHLYSSEDEDETLDKTFKFPFPSPTLTENVPPPALTENGISLAVQVVEEALPDASLDAMMFSTSAGYGEAAPSDAKHIEREDYISQHLMSTHSSEEDFKSWQIIDFPQNSGFTTEENGDVIDFLGDTKVDFRSLEGFKGLVLTERETDETSETGSREGGRQLQKREERDSSYEREVEKVNITVNLLEDWVEDHVPGSSLQQDKQEAIAALVDELDGLDPPLPPTTSPPPTTTRREENPYQYMNDDDSTSETSSEDSQGHAELSTEDVRCMEEQIIPSASTQELLACPEGPTGSPSDGSPDIAKDLRDTGASLQDFITPLRTVDDLFITASPSVTQESVLTNSLNDALKQDEEEEMEEAEKEENHTPLLSQYPERQDDDWTEVKRDSTVLEEVEECRSSPQPPQEESDDIMTGREFIKFCIFSIWFSLLIYFFSDVFE